MMAVLLLYYVCLSVALLQETANAVKKVGHIGYVFHAKSRLKLLFFQSPWWPNVEAAKTLVQ